VNARDDYRRVLCVGQAVVDHVFCEQEGEYIYQWSRGGGSSANIAANFAALGRKSTFVAEGDDGQLTDLARRDLECMDVDVVVVDRPSIDRTQALFQFCDATAATQKSPKFEHRFCVFSPDWREAREKKQMRSGEFIAPSPSRLTQMEIVRRAADHQVACFDRPIAAYVDIAASLRGKGVFTVLDWGHASGLRFLTGTRVVSILRSFDIILMTRKVWTHLAHRVTVDGRDSEARTETERVLQVLKGRGVNGTIVVTDGARTLSCMDCTTLAYVEVPPYSGAVFEASGAGDALLSRFVHRLLGTGTRGPRKHDFESKALALSSAVESLGDVLGGLGARCHLRALTNLFLDRRASGSSLHEILGGDISRFLGRGAEAALSAGSTAEGPKDSARKGSVTGRRVNGLVQKSIGLLETEGVVTATRETLQSIVGTGAVVGSGGSYTVANFIAQCINHRAKTDPGTLAVPMHPLEFVRAEKAFDWLIVISNSGTTRDCADAMRFGYHRCGIRRMILISGTATPEIGQTDEFQAEDTVHTVLEYPARSGQLERGFVAISAVVAPCAVWTAALEGASATASLLERYQALAVGDLDLSLERLADPELEFEGSFLHLPVVTNDLRLPHAPPIHAIAIGSGWCRPAIVDLESKFVEGRLGWIQLHDDKEFSHGRFMSVLTAGSSIDLCVYYMAASSETAYSRALLKTLEANDQLADRVLTVRTVQEGALGGLELLVRTQFFVAQIARRVSVDISKPGQQNIPKHGLDLYRWKRGLV
jgi:sugar/nucleoside kinase (ribokinase family)